jgi:superfamily II DNA or RNA helicase
MRTLEEIGLAPERDVFVRSIQELLVPGAVIPPATMLVFDEARHFVADEWSKIREVLPDAIVLGFDATPERGDGRGLGSMFERIVTGLPIRDAIAQGFLVPAEVLRPERALGPRELAQDPVDAYIAKAYGTSAVIYAASVDLAKDYADRIAGHGLHAAAIWGEMPNELRDYQLAEFAAGRIQVLTNFQILVEGFDAPRIETVVLARNFPTAGAMLQAIGRGLRPFPGKRRCLVLDLSGSTHIHGEPDEPRTWHLEGKAARRAHEEEGVRWCPICGSPVVSTPCGLCGYAGDEFKARKPRVLGLALDRFARQRAESDEQATKKLAVYMRIARQKGYREGWAVMRWQAVYGRNVTGEMKRQARSMI